MALFFCSIARGDEIIDAARGKLYTDYDKGLLLLEGAVEKSPHNVDYWAELISELDISSNNHEFAERASRTALRLNPRNPTLLLARARLLRAPDALEVLDELAQIPDEKARAVRIIEQVSLGLSVPDPAGIQREPYEQWGERLLVNGNFERLSKFSTKV